jgi:type 1 glutamine amidotransferase
MPVITPLRETEKIKLAVVVGGHPYDVPGFNALFEGIPDVAPYIQDLDNWAVSRVYDQYDAFLFFHMNCWGKYSVRRDMDEKIQAAIARIGETEQGVFILHHAILTFPDLDTYSALCNMDGRRDFTSPGHKFTKWADIEQQIANPDHPITQGLQTFTIGGEGFNIGNALPDNDILLTTDNPVSSRTLAWAHQHKKARIFCYIMGHDAENWNDPSFYTVLTRGIRWCAGRL